MSEAGSKPRRGRLLGFRVSRCAVKETHSESTSAKVGPGSGRYGVKAGLDGIVARGEGGDGRRLRTTGSVRGGGSGH
jgi:hypothetical protein